MQSMIMSDTHAIVSHARCQSLERLLVVVATPTCFTLKVINRALPSSAPLRVSLVAVHPCAPTTAISAAWCPANCRAE